MMGLFFISAIAKHSCNSAWITGHSGTAAISKTTGSRGGIDISLDFAHGFLNKSLVSGQLWTEDLIDKYLFILTHSHFHFF